MKLCNIRLGPTLGHVPGNAWQRLGNMSPEAAMEQYVALLSRDIPGWSVDDPHVQSQEAVNIFVQMQEHRGS
ncbi:hypothetical protein CK203_000823 [Vitis vinifera]|uniref:ACB domain-containing protein n=1 Tax=Vitis vinifera TaxID=29760 RepID=A0A438KQ74_VITVI|nr:hypothetical protein CK203_000823 [Vitis vinifera]